MEPRLRTGVEFEKGPLVQALRAAGLVVVRACAVTSRQDGRMGGRVAIDHPWHGYRTVTTGRLWGAGDEPDEEECCDGRRILDRCIDQPPQWDRAARSLAARWLESGEAADLVRQRYGDGYSAPVRDSMRDLADLLRHIEDPLVETHPDEEPF